MVVSTSRTRSTTQGALPPALQAAVAAIDRHPLRTLALVCLAALALRFVAPMQLNPWSLLFNLLCIPFCFGVVRLGFRNWVALLASLVLAMHPGSVLSTRTADPDALLMVVASASSWFVLRLERRRTPLDVLALAGITALGMLLEPRFACLPLAQLVYLLWQRRKRFGRAWPTLTALIVAFLAAMAYHHMNPAPLFNERILPRGNGNELLDGLEVITGLMAGEAPTHGLFTWQIFPFLALACAVLIIVWRAMIYPRRLVNVLQLPINKLHEDHARQVVRYAVCWGLLQPLLLFGYLWAKGFDATAQLFYVPMLPGWCLLTGLALALIHRPRWRALTILLVNLFLLLMTLHALL